MPPRAPRDSCIGEAELAARSSAEVGRWDDRDRATHSSGMTQMPEIPAELIGPDRMDELARQAAQAVCEGNADRDSGHHYLAGLLYRSAIPDQVASAAFKQSAPARGRQTYADLASRLRSLMVSKILLDENGHSVVNLTMVASGTSFSGFVRKFLEKASQSELRNLATEYRRTRVVSAASGDDETVEPLEGRPHASAEDTYLDQRMLEVAGQFTDRAHATRPLERLHLQAAALAQAFALPEPTRVWDSAQRQEILHELDADPKAAYRVVVAMARGDLVDSALIDLFGDWQADHLETLVETDPRVAEVIARAAATAVPPIHQRNAKELRKRFVADMDPSSTMHHLALATLRAWLTSCTTIIGDEFNSYSFKSDEQVADEAAEYTRQATRLLRAGYTGPDTPERLSAWLLSESEHIAAEHAIARR